MLHIEHFNYCLELSVDHKFITSYLIYFQFKELKARKVLLSEGKSAENYKNQFY